MTTKQTKSAVALALQAPEDDVKKPTQRRSSSFAAQIDDLEVGQSAIASSALPKEISMTEALPLISERKQDMRNSVGPAVTKMKKKNPDRDYTVETAELITSAAGWMVLAVVTRTA